jgi:hypothetical protein
MRTTLLAGIGAAGLAVAALALAQEHDHSMHQHMMETPTPGAVMPADSRQAVHFPKDLREHTLANMRDHLLSLQRIEEALAVEDYDKAADIAERRLGMSSLGLHGAHEVAKYMPPGMQDIGSAMHHSASQFARAAEESSATGDIKPALAALSRITANCVACHSGYRVQD